MFNSILYIYPGIACWLDRQTRDQKVASSNPGRSSGRIFFSRVNFVCWLLFDVCSTPHVTAVARKRPQSFCQKCRWQVTPLTHRSQSGNLSGNELTRNSSGNTQSESPQLAEPLWIDPGLKSGISLRELISIKKKERKKTAQAGNELSNILLKSSHARKKATIKRIHHLSFKACQRAENN